VAENKLAFNFGLSAEYFTEVWRARKRNCYGSPTFRPRVHLRRVYAEVWHWRLARLDKDPGPQTIKK